MAGPRTELVQLPDGEYSSDNLAPLTDEDEHTLAELGSDLVLWLLDGAELSETDPPPGAQDGTPTPPLP